MVCKRLQERYLLQIIALFLADKVSALSAASATYGKKIPVHYLTQPPKLRFKLNHYSRQLCR